jgi:hypothetical protein
MAGSLSLQLSERLAIADYELQVAHARCSNVRVVDFGELTVVECVPNLAGGRVRGPEAILVCLGPDRPLARGPGAPPLGAASPGFDPLVAPAMTTVVRTAIPSNKRSPKDMRWVIISPSPP